MSFALASIQSVRSANQRALLAQWNGLCAGRNFPELTEFQPGENDLKQLVLWDVEGDGEGRIYRMRKPGLLVVEGFDADHTGKTMDEMVPRPLRHLALDAANQCADTGCATYSVITIVDARGHPVDCERLLLPFGRDNVAVEHIVAAVQLISFQGAVDRHGIVHEFEAKPHVSLSVMIPATSPDGRMGKPLQRPSAAVSPFATSGSAP